MAHSWAIWQCYSADKRIPERGEDACSWPLFTIVDPYSALFYSPRNDISRPTLRQLYSHAHHPDIRNFHDFPSKFKQGLVDAYVKLSQNFKKLDASPYYMWSACSSQFLVSTVCFHLTLLPSVLGPRPSDHAPRLLGCNIAVQDVAAEVKIVVRRVRVAILHSTCGFANFAC
jgi:hypothetical protein